jgi:hypothetical protein
VRQAATQLVQVLLAQHLSLSLIGTPGHAGAFYSVRCLFAIRPGREPTGQGRSYAVRCGVLRLARCQCCPVEDFFFFVQVAAM